jgi:NAD-dependent DNA ligase
MNSTINNSSNTAGSNTYTELNTQEKSAFSLKGLLLGLVADNELNSKEIMFLDLWIKSQTHLLDDPASLQILDITHEILVQKSVNQDQLDALYHLVEDIINGKEIHLFSDTDKVSELYGFLKGITSDNELTDAEILRLNNWLAHNRKLKDVWPANVLLISLNNILEDNIISEYERAILVDTIDDICKNKFTSTNAAYDCTTSVITGDVSALVIEGNNICFSGKFISGSRKHQERIAKKQHATTQADVSPNVTILVIGTLASRDWVYSHHGKKIEAALTLQKSGQQLTIISEEQWLMLLSKTH